MINRQLYMGTPWGGGRSLPTGRVEEIRAKSAQLPYLYQQQRDNEYQDRTLAQSASQFNQRMAFDEKVRKENAKNAERAKWLNYASLGLSTIPPLYTAFMDDGVQAPVEAAIDTLPNFPDDVEPNLPTAITDQGMNFDAPTYEQDESIFSIPGKILDTGVDFFSGVFDSLFGD